TVSVERWKHAMAALEVYVAREGHAQVPFRHVEGECNLGSWVRQRRNEYLHGHLEPGRARSLERLPGWSWHPFEDRFNEHFEHLVAYVRREGHSRVPQMHRESGWPLGKWVLSRRVEHHRGRLAPERIALLESQPGWTWSAKDLYDRSEVERTLEALQSFRRRV